MPSDVPRRDHALESWFALADIAAKQKASAAPGTNKLSIAVAIRCGFYRGIIRSLAADVPEARDWLMAHLPDTELDT